MSDDYDVGVLVAGSPASPRHLVEHRRTLEAFADGSVEFADESYLSHFVFGPGMESHYKQNGGSVAGFEGPCRADWLVLDIDRNDLSAALADTRRLAEFLAERYGTDPAVWFSGAKGYHIALRLAHDPSPSATFPTVARSFARFLADGAGVAIDESLYDRARIIRLPNTKHPKTGLFKRRIDLDILPFFSPEALREHCAEPAGDGLPVWRGNTDRLADDWAAVEARVGRAAQARAERRATFTPDERAPRYLLEFLRFGVPEGERASVLFRCAAWLTEQGAPPSLCAALLTEAGLDCGLPPSEVRRQIACGIAHAQRQRGAVNAVVAEAPAQAPAAAPAVAEPDPDADYEAYERWCIQHEANPWPEPEFPFGGNAPIEETSAEPTPALADVPTQPTRERWQAVLERLTGDPQAVRQALQQLSIPDADLTRPAKGGLPT
jgi:hypothetical protein